MGDRRILKVMRNPEPRPGDESPRDEGLREFDAREFLDRYAAAYNRRHVAGLRAVFALEDPGFSVFEEFSGELLSGSIYGDILDSVRDATGEMSFDLLRSDSFGEYTAIQAIQKIVDSERDKGFGEALIRVTLWIAFPEGAPRVVMGHYSSMMCCFPKRTGVFRSWLWERLKGLR